MSFHRASSRRLPPLTAAVLLAALLCLPVSGAAQTRTLVSMDGGAYISLDSRNVWTIGNDRVALTLGLNTRNALALSKFRRLATGEVWTLDPVGDFDVRAGSRVLDPGQGDFAFRFSAVGEEGGGVRLSLVFESPSAHLRATRTWACFPGAPAIESWITYETIGTADPVTIGDITLIQLRVAGSAVNWVTGLRPIEEVPSFTRQRRDLAEGLNLEAPRRATTVYLPVIWLDGEAGSLAVGLAWSGTWAMSASPAEPGAKSEVRAWLGASETTVKPGVPFETPHAFAAVAARDDVSSALAEYAQAGIRQGRPFAPALLYNTWYAYGVRLGESSLFGQIAHAAELGSELFVVDAGWYAGGLDAFDYTTGIGTWVPDPERFPNGLRPISDAVHAYGMRFGIWMEPERIDLNALNRPVETDPETGEPLPIPETALQEGWLAASGGAYEPDAETPVAAQVCLANPRARQWVLEQVSRVIEESGAEYLKWDNNFWVNCDREGHGHGPNDGNLLHHLGLYEVLRQLRERFPNLVIENCAQGGNRVDFGMMRYTDVAWMDDVTAPSAHVRHNLQGLGAVLPPSYLLSFLTDDPSEPIVGAGDLPAYVRSRMPGSLGLSVRGEQLGDWDREALVAEAGRYKVLRDAMLGAPLLMLTPQEGTPETDGWDAMQMRSPVSGNSVVYAFAAPWAAESTVLRLRALDPESIYLVSMGDGTVIGEAQGSLLMADGIGVPRLPESSGIVLLVTRIIPPEAAAKKK